MSPAIRAELFKQRSARTATGLLATMTGLVLLVVLVHGLGLAPQSFGTRSDQLDVLFGWGGVFGSLFAGLLGAMTVTSEFRFGTIRPTLLANPARRRLITAKTAASMTLGSVYGLIAGALTAGIGAIALRHRGIEVRIDGVDVARIIIGSTVAAALWAAVGVGVGAVVRSQVPALVGLVVWSLFIENLLVGDIAGVGTIGRYLPGASARAISGQQATSLLSPAAGLIVLVAYAALAAILGSTATTRRDVT